VKLGGNALKFFGGFGLEFDGKQYFCQILLRREIWFRNLVFELLLCWIFPRNWMDDDDGGVWYFRGSISKEKMELFLPVISLILLFSLFSLYFKFLVLSYKHNRVVYMIIFALSVSLHCSSVFLIYFCVYRL